MQLGARATALDVEVIPTGSLALDHALGIGGLPRGRVVEIYGPESSGKTTLALHVVAEAQRAGMNCCFIDAEHALDPTYARAVGVQLESLYLAQPDTGEQALEIADTLVRSGAMDVLVVDSVAALVPKAEIEGEMGDHHMALQARLMSQALRKLTASLGRSKTLIIFINQIRSKVGVIFGSPDVTPGGNALKFYASVRMEIRRSGQIKAGEEVVGNLTRVKVAKNKLAPPFRVADFEMTYGTGINRAAEAVDLGVAFGTLRKSGAWYSIVDAELLGAVNAAYAAAGRRGGAGEGGAAPPTVTAALDAPMKGGKKATRAAAAAAAAAAAEAAAAAATAPPLHNTPALAHASHAATAAGSHSAAPAPAVALGEAFMQGRERMKEFFDDHDDVLRTALRVVKAAMKRSTVDGVATAAAARTARAGGPAATSAPPPHSPLPSTGGEGGGHLFGAASAASGIAISGNSGDGLAGGMLDGAPLVLSSDLGGNEWSESDEEVEGGGGVAPPRGGVSGATRLG